MVYEIYAEVHEQTVEEEPYEPPPHVESTPPPRPEPTPPPLEPTPALVYELSVQNDEYIEINEVIIDITHEIEHMYYIEATVDELSPQTLEIESETAYNYATEGFTDNVTGAGIETLEHETDNVITVEELTNDNGQAEIGDEGGVVGVLAIYSSLLRQGINTMFPCQMLYVYVEMAGELETVARGSMVYQLIVDSGGLSVSSRLTADNLTVEVDWVVRRNPDIIVKFVNEDVLGSGVTNNYAAAEFRSLLISRQEWGLIEAVRNDRVLLLSEQLLETEEARLAVRLVMAYMMYPELFVDIAINAIITNLLSGMEGNHIYGIAI